MLRTILRAEDGSLLVDNWYLLDTMDELIDKVIAIDPTNYECYKSEDITNDVFVLAEEREEQLEYENAEKDRIRSEKEEMELYMRLHEKYGKKRRTRKKAD